MFQLAFLIALYSYFIFALGLLHLLRRDIILVTTIILFLILIKTFLKQFINFLLTLKVYLMSAKFLQTLLFSLITIQVFVNLVGALGPELAFDALWYHLTIPKIYLQQDFIFI